MNQNQRSHVSTFLVSQVNLSKPINIYSVTGIPECPRTASPTSPASPPLSPPSASAAFSPSPAITTCGGIHTDSRVNINRCEKVNVFHIWILYRL